MLEFAPARVSIFRRGRGEARRLVFHVHDIEETTASSMQIDETDADELLQEMAGALPRGSCGMRGQFLRFQNHMKQKIAAEEARWAARVARRESSRFHGQTQRIRNV